MNEAKQPGSNVVGKDERPPIVVLRDRLMSRQGELRAALTDVSVEQFIRAIMTSVSLNPDILACSWQSIWNNCLKACRDGLLPDGVDGALVPYKGNVTWIPMYQGLLRRFRRSGQFKWVTAGIVRQGEIFEHYIDQDGEHFKHVPGDGAETSPIVKVYAVATTKDGGIFVTVLPIAEVEKIRAMSKATREDSPWRLWFSEMAKKTALRRLSKVLPSARDLAPEEPPELEHTAVGASDAALPRISSPRASLDQFGVDGRQRIEHFDSETGELSPPAHKQSDVSQPNGSPDTEAVTAPQTDDPLAVAYRAGMEARTAGVQRRAVPGEYRDATRQKEALAWLAGHDGEPRP